MSQYLYLYVFIILVVSVLLVVLIFIFFPFWEEKKREVRVPITSVKSKHIWLAVQQARRRIGEEVMLQQTSGGWYASTKTFGPCYSLYPLEALYRLEMQFKEKTNDGQVKYEIGKKGGGHS